MNDLAPIFERVAVINPVPDENDLPAHAMAAAALLDVVDERTGTMQTKQTQTRPQQEPKRRRTGALLALTTFAVVIVIGGVTALTGNGAPDSSSVTSPEPASVNDDVILAGDVLPRAMSTAMEDTISTDELLIVDRGTYDSGDPERLDIALYANPRPEDGLYDEFLGRIVGLGGETIEARDGGLYVNGSLLDEPYLKNPQIPMATFGPITLGPDEVWLMGDNRQVPMHSRVFGPIPVLGTAR